MYVCMYVCMSVCLSVCLSVCMYACMHAWMHACMYVCMYVCIKNLTIPSRKMAAGKSLRHVRVIYVISISYVLGWIANWHGKSHHSIATLFWGALFANETAKNAMSEMMAAEKPTFFGMFLGTAFLVKKIALLAVSTTLGASYCSSFLKDSGTGPYIVSRSHLVWCVWNIIVGVVTFVYFTSTKQECQHQ